VPSLSIHVLLVQPQYVGWSNATTRCPSIMPRPSAQQHNVVNATVYKRPTFPRLPPAISGHPPANSDLGEDSLPADDHHCISCQLLQYHCLFPACLTNSKQLISCCGSCDE